jgi:hypothetical protein
MKLQKIRAGLYQASIAGETVSFERADREWNLWPEASYQHGLWCVRYGDYDHRNTGWAFQTRAEAVFFALNPEGAQS